MAALAHDALDAPAKDPHAAPLDGAPELLALPAAPLAAPAQAASPVSSFRRLARFFEKRHGVVLAAWVVVFAVSCAFGTRFLSLLRSGGAYPPNSPIKAASEASARLFPDPPQGPVPSSALVVQRALASQSIVCAASQNFSVALAAFCVANGNSTVGSIEGYFELLAMSPLLALVAATAVSPDNSTMLTSVNFLPGSSPATVDLFITALSTWAPAQSTGRVKITTTGSTQINQEWTGALNADFVTTEASVLPFAMLALGLRLQSYRHMALALLTLVVTMLLAFAILVPISEPGVLDIDPSALLIMASLGIALSFDYSLFILSRFREERAEESGTVSVTKAESAEGEPEPHVSGKVEAVERTLETAGHSVAVSGCVLVAMYLLLACFSQPFLRSIGVTCAVVTATAVATNLSILPCLLLWLDCLSHFEACPTRTSCCCRVPSRDPAREPRATANNCASRLAWTVSGALAKWVLLSAFLVLVGVFASFYAHVNPIDDLELYVLQGSPSQLGLLDLTRGFGPAVLNPYSVVLNAGAPGAVLTPAFFTAEADVIARLLACGSGVVTASSFVGVSYFNGVVPLSLALAYLNASDPAYATEAGATWRALSASRMNADMSASSLGVTTLIDPKSAASGPFVDAARATLLNAEVPAYLLGGYTYSLDNVRYIYGNAAGYTCGLVAIIIVGVGATFRSVALIVRLVATLGSTLALVFGLMTLVYVPPYSTVFEPVTPWLNESPGVAWLVPFACLSILVGLGLDYDVFLMLRIAEFREKGWSDRAAASLAVGRTAAVISTAGIIMTISFGGLLGPKIMIVNEYGFALFVGVLIDTFLIRPLVVPAILSAAPRESQLNWWPRQMPAVALDEEEERAAVEAGCDAPPPPRAAALLLRLPAALEGRPKAEASSVSKDRDAAEVVVAAS